MIKRENAIPGLRITFKQMISGFDAPGNIFEGGITVDDSDEGVLQDKPKKKQGITTVPVLIGNRVYYFFWQDIYRYGCACE